MKNVNRVLLSSVATVSLMFSACGGGSTSSVSGDTGVVTALELPGNIDVIKAAADTNSNAKFSKLSSQGVIESKYTAPSGSDYATDTTQFWVKDDSTEALTVVNMIMGFIRDTNYAEFLGKGPYIAMIKDDEEQAGNEDSSKGQTSSNDTEQLTEFVVNVSRADNNSPMVIDGWLSETGEDINQDISFKIEVTREVSTDYPAGEFTMYIKGVRQDTGAVFMRNILQVGRSGDATFPVSVKYRESGGQGTPYPFEAEANLLATTDFTTGKAYTKSGCYDEATHQQGICEYKIAYNSKYAKTDLTSLNGIADADTTGTIFDKANYTYKIYNYGLYDETTGNRPELNAGKHIKVTVGGKTYHGSAGYWGVWAGRDNLDLTNATIVDDNANNYTVFTAPGKLEKHVKQTITLNELDGVEMGLWSNNSEKIIEWSKADQKFYQTGTRTWSGTGPTETPTSPKVELTALNVNEWDGAWCNSLQAYFNIGRLFNVRGVAVATPPANDTTLKYFKRTNVIPGTLATNLDLVAYSDTKFKGTVTKASIGGSSIVERVNFGTINWATANVDATFKNSYTFDKDTMTLNAGTSVDASKNIVFASDINRNYLNTASVDYSWGLNVEPLLDSATLAAVTSDLGSITLENWWQVRDTANSFYSWNTSVEDWSKLQVLKQSDGTFVAFDQPWEISYTHATVNDRDGLSVNDGKKFRLHFDGSNLSMPWKYDSAKKIWKPVLALKDDVVLTYKSKNYVIKALDGEKLLNKVTSAQVVAAGGIEPNLSNVTLAATGIDLGAVDDISFVTRPTTELNVKVIKGITQ